VKPRHAIVLVRDGKEKLIPYTHTKTGMQKLRDGICRVTELKFIVNYQEENICIHCQHQFECLLDKKKEPIYCFDAFQEYIRTQHHNFRKEPPEGYPMPETRDELFCLLGIKARWAYLIRGHIDDYYTTFKIKKSTLGKFRTIEAPNDRLRNIQRNILHRVLDRIPLGDHVGAYRKQHNCRELAARHTGRAVVIKMDLKDFFPSIRRYDVYKCLRFYGLTHEVSHSISCFVTYKNHVPQGAPTSGAIANLVASWRFDQAIIDYLKKLDPAWRYDRYADDLIISHPVWQSKETITQLIRDIEAIIRKGGFYVNKKKVKVVGKNRSQVVLGLCVNEKVNLRRRDYMRIRAIIHNVAKNGLSEEAKKAKVEAAKFYQVLSGWMSYIKSVSIEKYQKLLPDWEAVKNAVSNTAASGPDGRV